MFNYSEGKKNFRFGLVNYEMARKAAAQCTYFKEDDEDEQVDSFLKSCYNCIYRRWSSESFQCMKK